MRSLAERSSWQATVTSGRPSRHAMCSTKRVLPQPVGPLSITGSPRAWHCSKISHLVARRHVVRLLARPAHAGVVRVRRVGGEGERAGSVGAAHGGSALVDRGSVDASGPTLHTIANPAPPAGREDLRKPDKRRPHAETRSRGERTATMVLIRLDSTRRSNCFWPHTESTELTEFRFLGGSGGYGAHRWSAGDGNGTRKLR